MKKILLILSLLMLSVSAFGQQSGSAEKSGIVFDKKAFDFGDVLRENKNYTCVFTLENKTDKPLVLLSVKTSCSCLKAQYVRRPLKVGQTTDIVMTLEAGKMEKGVFHRVVEVHTNSGVAYITVRGNSIEK
ncbi:MAG: DUF1573 domain-containing protein [Alistipes sp.]|nr:DUF1573 domain-containing protein [Alistipes sp.]